MFVVMTDMVFDEMSKRDCVLVNLLKALCDGGVWFISTLLC